MDELCDRSLKLIKEATQYKQSDINKAIRLIEEAIRLNPPNELSLYFKLAKYLHIAGDIEKSYSIYSGLIAELNKNDIVMYNMNISTVTEKLCTQLYADKRYEDYILHYCIWCWNRMIAYACQSRMKELEEFLDNKNKLSCLAPTKVIGSFKKLNKERGVQFFNEQLNTLYNSFKTKFFILCNLSKASYDTFMSKLSEFGDLSITRSPSECPIEWNMPIGEHNNILLRQNADFMSLYTEFNGFDIKLFFNTNFNKLSS